MKNIIFILLALALLTGCLSETEVRKVKIGMTTEELVKTLDGDPFSIEIEPGYEQWYYTYYTGGCGRKNGLCVYVKDNKVIDFYSY